MRTLSNIFCLAPALLLYLWTGGCGFAVATPFEPTGSPVEQLNRLASSLAFRSSAESEIKELVSGVEHQELERVTWRLIEILESNPAEYKGNVLAFYGNLNTLLQHPDVFSSYSVQRARASLEDQEFLALEKRWPDAVGHEDSPKRTTENERQMARTVVGMFSLRLNIIAAGDDPADAIELLRGYEAHELVGSDARYTIQRIEARLKRSAERP